MSSALNINVAVPQEGFADELKPGTTLLNGQYTIESFLKVGGFGMTYLARDSLDRIVVVKECFPGSLCSREKDNVRPRSRAHQEDFRSVVRLFVQEARRLASVRHPNIVGVHQVFEDNETAYMALDFIEGDDLLDIIGDDGFALPPSQISAMLAKLLDAIGHVHEHALLHRDISPDNILLDRSGEPVLIDFGAAREQASKKSRVLSALHVVKDGYSPHEFYISDGPQAPCSDLYSLGATFCHLITGEAPPNSQMRLAAVAEKKDDPYVPLAGRLTGYDPAFLAAVDKAMNLFPSERPQSAKEWLDLIAGDTAQAAPCARARNSDITVVRTISRLVAETNEAVLAACQQEEERKKAMETAPPEEEVKKPYFSWQLEEDWLLGQEEEDEACELAGNNAEDDPDASESLTGMDGTEAAAAAGTTPPPADVPAQAARDLAGAPDGTPDPDAEPKAPKPPPRSLLGRFGRNLRAVLRA